MLDTLRERGGRDISPEEMARVKDLPLFHNLSQDDISGLFANAATVESGREEILYEEGDVANRFYILLEGNVELFTRSSSQRESIIEILTPGDVFDIAAIFEDKKFPTGAKVMETATLVIVDAEHFMSTLSANVDVVLDMMASMSKHLKGLVKQVSELKLMTTGQRLGSFILGLTDIESGEVTVQLPYDKKMLASLLGMQPESLSRAFGKLKEVGVVSRSNMIGIDNIARLREFCRESVPG